MAEKLSREELLAKVRNLLDEADNVSYPSLSSARYVRKIMRMLVDEIERLDAWANEFSNAQLKERRLCEERIQEMQREIARLVALSTTGEPKP